MLKGMSDRPNILLIMTDEERYPTPYEGPEIQEFRRTQTPARTALRASGVELHRHYAGSTACSASRATLFTGQYPSLHGVSQTDGISKSNTEVFWLDPNTVPTMGDWFRAGGYQAHYRGKWHISHADLPLIGTHEGLMSSDFRGQPIPEALAAYGKADRLEPFGFSGWIGREPHGIGPQDMGLVRDGLYAEQVSTMFSELSKTRSEGPWLAVASFVNPHDILFQGMMWNQMLHLDGPDDTVPDIPQAPSQADSFAGRPTCQEDFALVWPQMTYPQEADLAYRRLYYYLHKVVDKAIGRILSALHDSGMADDTIVILTSDHGDLIGAHGGMFQKWYNAFDESIRVPMLVSGPDVATPNGGHTMPTSHVDLIPTMLGLAGIDIEAAKAVVAKEHTEAQDLPGRDLSGLIRGNEKPEEMQDSLYFMTEDDFTRGSNNTNPMTGAAFEPVRYPSKVESVVASLPTGQDGTAELWKLNHYYERLDEWNAEHGVVADPKAPKAADPLWEMHNLTRDPEERDNLAESDIEVRGKLRTIMDEQRDAKRKLPMHRNPQPPARPTP